MSTLELADDGGLLLLRGLVAPTGTWRRAGWFAEHFRVGCFARSARSAPEVTLAIEDEAAETTLATGDMVTFSEGTGGLAVEARLDASSDAATRLRDAVHGACALAFSFRAPDQRWTADLTRRTISKVDLHGGHLAVRTARSAERTPSLALDREARQAAVERLGDAVRGSVDLRIAAALAASERTALELRLAVADARRRELVGRLDEIRRRAR